VAAPPLQKVSIQAVEAVAGTRRSVLSAANEGKRDLRGGKELSRKPLSSAETAQDPTPRLPQCSALPETLMAMLELSADEKGRFTGADSAKPG